MPLMLCLYMCVCERTENSLLLLLYSHPLENIASLASIQLLLAHLPSVCAMLLLRCGHSLTAAAALLHTSSCTIYFAVVARAAPDTDISAPRDPALQKYDPLILAGTLQRRRKTTRCHSISAHLL